MPKPAPFPALTPYDLSAVPQALRGGVVAIGSFDGVHKGHQALISTAREMAGEIGAPTLVLTFEPHPRAVLRPDTPVFRLTPLEGRARVLKALGVDGLVVIPFDRAFASNSASAFISDCLIGRLGLKGAVLGHDFRFGRGREGTVAMLAEAGLREGFAVVEVGRIDDDSGIEYASSTIRRYLTEGDIAAANAQLGYRWFVEGEVVQGDQRGRTLGYPTANIRLGNCALRHGIYAVKLQRPSGAVLDGVASYGRRPTFDDGAPLLEVFAFDFSGDLYGEVVSVSFVDWIRPELKFSSIEELVAAMDEDSRQARAVLAAAGAGTALDQALLGG